MYSRLTLLFCLTVAVYNSFSQSKETTVPWFFPGVIYKANPKLELWSQYGINYRQGIHALYLQGFIKTGRHFIINPAYLYLNIDRQNGSRLHEHTLMNAFIYTFNLNKLVVDDRNMFWNRFRLHEKDVHFYRNRLRMTWHVNTYPVEIKFYLFDEATFSFSDGSFTRNRLAVGLNCKIIQWLLLDVALLRERDTFNGNTNLLFVMAMLELPHHKVEQNSQHK